MASDPNLVVAVVVGVTALAGVVYTSLLQRWTGRETVREVRRAAEAALASAAASGKATEASAAAVREARTADTKLQVWRQREETMRMVRWGLEQTASTNPFTDQSTATGSMFAAYASMALLAAARHDTANHLTRALETNREIGVAMGILMANGRLTSPRAVEQLRTASQNVNRKLHDIAADVARTGALPRAALKLVRRR